MTEFCEVPAELEPKAVHLIWSDALDKFIESKLGRKWHLQQGGDMYGQDTLVEYEIWPDPEATATVAAWLASPPARFPGRWPDVEEGLNNPPPDGQSWNETVEIATDTILNELCNRGLLPEHTMHVHVWW